MKKDILLIFPGEKTVAPRLPLPILSLASYLRKNKITVDVLDTKVDDYTKINYNNYSCIGISSMSGEQLQTALAVAKHIKKNSNSPLIWGGPHVSFFPDQSIKSIYVDAVVKREGEKALLEIVKRIKKNKSLKGVKNTLIKENGEIINNPEETEFIDMDTLDLPAYDLVDMKRYSALDYFSYESSRGCPFRCSFCYSVFFHKRVWRPKSAEKVLKELEEIKTKYNPKQIYFVDDNFFVDVERVRKICKGMIKKNFNFEWIGFVRADLLRNFITDKDMRLLKKSGCNEIYIGAESGSPYVLEYMEKDTTPEDIMEATKKAVRHKIPTTLTFIIGCPKERKKDLNRTMDFITKLYSLGDLVSISGAYIYTPYPGASMFYDAVERGYTYPQEFEGWANKEHTFVDAEYSKHITWFNKSEQKEVKTISNIVRFKFFIKKLELNKEFRDKKIKGIDRIIYLVSMPLLKMSSAIRWKNKFFKFPFEWDLYHYLYNKKYRIK